MQSQTEYTPNRRLVLCCDGTWNNAEGGRRASNVVRLARSVKSIAADGASQVVYYHPGVGTGNRLDHVIGGTTGVGLARNVRDAYAYLVNNYVPGDEIFLFGFSRGAYTARAVSGLIDTIGLLRGRDMGRFLDAWAFYRLPAAVKHHQQDLFEQAFPGRITGLRIRCIGVWDTVGSLGIPANRWFGRLQVCRSNYRFLSVKLCPTVEYAFQALALDEKRIAFAPAVWERDPNAKPGQVIRQVWFAGVHSDIGGGYQEHGAADLAFLWMAGQVSGLLELDKQNIAAELDKSQVYQQGLLHESLSRWWRILGQTLHRRLNTGANEEVHASVIKRLERDGAYHPHRQNQIRQLPVAELSPFEKQFSWPQPQAAAPATPRFQKTEVICDRIVRFLGGG